MPRSEPVSRRGFRFFFFASPDQFTPNSFKTTLFPPERTRTPPKHPANEGRKHTKEGDFYSKTREEMNKNGELIPQYRLRFVQPPNNCIFFSAHSAPSSRFFTNRPHLLTGNSTKQKRDNRQIKHKTELSAETL